MTQDRSQQHQRLRQAVGFATSVILYGHLPTQFSPRGRGPPNLLRVVCPRILGVCLTYLAPLVLCQTFPIQDMRLGLP